MKIFANRSIWKKIVIIFSLIFSMSFVEPTPVKAGIGGTLMEPVCDLLVGLADGFMNISQSVLLGQDNTLIRVNKKGEIADRFRKIFAIITVLFVAFVAVAFVGGVLVPIAATIGEAIGLTALATSVAFGSIVPIAVGSLWVGVMAYDSDLFEDEIVLPMYSLSPEKIFSNTYPIFDVNFFNPNSTAIKYEWAHKNSLSEEAEERYSAKGKYVKIDKEKEEKLDFSNAVDITEEFKKDFSTWQSNDGQINEELIDAKQIEVNGEKYVQYNIRQTYGDGGSSIRTEKRMLNDGANNDNQGSSSNGSSDANGAEESMDKFAITKELQNTIKFWYRILKILAIVSMMSVLVYIGIRILLSSTSEQKAKYKELLQDWIIGMVLLFTMQYIMVFANIAVDHLTDLMGSINPLGEVALIPDENGAIEKELSQWNIEVKEEEQEGNGLIVAKRDNVIIWRTDLMGQFRIALQHNKDNSEEYIGYTIMYIVLVIYTGTFILTYIKRVILMAFLTIISPLVALTYPIDKVNDGTAQGFNYWFKEYIFNLLLQPVHLLIYTVFISTAIRFATKNMIYALVVLGFITQAEKILRQMFNFSKANTPGIFAGPAGAALTMSGMKWLMGHGPQGSIKSGGAKSSNVSTSSNNGNNGFLKTKNDKYDKDKVIRDWLGNESTNSSKEKLAKSTGNITNKPTTDNNNQTSSLSLLERMRDAELDESTYIPDNEQLQMWDNDARSDNSDNGMPYSDSEYQQILRESGYSDEQIANIMQSPLGRMRDAELDESKYLPNNEQLQMWDNDARSESSDNGMTYSDKEYQQILQDSGYSNDEIAHIMGTNPSNSDNIEQSVQNEDNISIVENGNENNSDIAENGNEDNTSISEKINESLNKGQELERPSFRRALGATASVYGEGIKDKIRDSLQNAHPGRTLGRAMGAAIGATAFGTAGIAMGVASGDLKNVMTNGIAGVAGGAKVGSGTVNSVSSTLSVDGLHEVFDKSYYGEELIAKQNREKIATSKEWIDEIMETEGLPKVEAIKRAKELAEYLKYDKSLNASKCMKLDKHRKRKTVKKPGETKPVPMSIQEVTEFYKMIPKYGIANMKGPDDRDKLTKQVASDLHINENSAERLVDEARELYIDTE